MVLSLAGLYVPLVTPFTARGEVCAGALESLAHEVIDGGAAGIVALGTTGEPATLSAAERRTVLDVCARVCRERSATLIAGAGSNDTLGSARSLAELRAWPEVSAALVAVPYYTRPGLKGVLAHFTRLAERSPLPLVIYNIPYRTGQVVPWQTLLRLAGLPGVAGFKHAVGAIDEDTVRLMAGRGAGCAVLAGDDAFASPLLALGAAGAILASAHVCTPVYAELVSAWREGEAARGRDLGHRLSALSSALFAEPNPTVIKAVLHAQGRIPSPAVRLPLTEAEPGNAEAALSCAAALAGEAAQPRLAHWDQHSAVPIPPRAPRARRAG
jgi:4-hydroxy-tetrahydrodipicolinate synthase